MCIYIERDIKVWRGTQNVYYEYEWSTKFGEKFALRTYSSAALRDPDRPYPLGLDVCLVLECIRDGKRSAAMFDASKMRLRFKRRATQLDASKMCRGICFAGSDWAV